MSGNPFRASLQVHPAVPPSPQSSSHVNTADGSTSARSNHGRNTSVTVSPPATKKSVRIESPTQTPLQQSAFQDGSSHLYSPLESQRVRHAQYSGDPPPISPAGFSDNFDGIEVDGAEGDIQTRDMSAALTRSMRPETVQSPSRAPLNPFARTLATMEPPERAGGELAVQKDRTAPTGATRASLDVEGFKNMLLFGITKGIGSPTNTPPSTSSGSRQSVFETVDSHSESRRTSYEMAASDDEQTNLIMGEANRKKEKKKPPPAPKPRHGKLVSSRTPQVVSFESFSATEPTVSPPASTKKASSDLNKPLPSAPSGAHTISQDSTHDSSSVPADTKRIPPPVPLARRHSQLRNAKAESNRSRSNSSLTISSQHSTDIAPSTSGSLSLKEEPESTYSALSPSLREKAPPPPPPTRHRGAALSAISNSSANSSSTELSSTTGPARKPVTSPNMPTSARRTTLSSEPPSPVLSTGHGRTPSINSVRTSHRAVSSESTGSVPVMAPPPPPPRRRQSSRSSLDKERPMSMAYPPSSSTEPRRTSSDASKRRTSAASESSLKYAYTPAASAVDGVGEHPLYSPREDEGEKRDAMEHREGSMPSTASILEDMDKFQKEIEELRAKYEHAA